MTTKLAETPGTALAAEIRRKAVPVDQARRIEIAKEARQLGAALRKDVAVVRASRVFSR
jgi:hypothetical protein